MDKQVLSQATVKALDAVANEGQISKVEAMMESQRGQRGGGGGGGGQRGQGGQRGGQNEEARAAAIKQLKSILDDGQFNRFREISLQQAGGNALMQAEVAKELNLTADQKSKVEGYSQDMRDEFRDMFQNGGGGDRQAMMEEMQDIREHYSKKMLGVLNSDQEKKWKEMLGKPFKLVRA